MKKDFGYLLKFENNEEGRYLLHLLEKGLNSTSYRLVCRGSRPNHKAAKKEGQDRTFQRSVPLKYAQDIRVYVHAKLDNNQTTVLDIGTAKELDKCRQGNHARLEKVRELKQRIRTHTAHIETAMSDMEMTLF